MNSPTSASETRDPTSASEAPFPRGAAFEKLAFTLCKIATFALFTGRFALPIAALGAAIFFALAHFNGQRDTRCIGKHPLLISAFWTITALVWVWLNYGRG